MSKEVITTTQKKRKLVHEYIGVNDVFIPEEMMNPTKFDEPHFNYGFSELGGLIPSQVVLLTGVAGGGKTTLCGCMGSKIIHPNPPVFASLEMSDFQLVLQTKKIPGFDKFLIVRKIINIEDFLLDLEQLKPPVVIVDSLQELASQFGRGDKYQYDIVKAFTDFAKKTFIPVILIGHCTKDGTYKGPTDLMHKVDTHMHIFIEKFTGDRYWKFNKNRFGGDVSEVPFKILGDKILIGTLFDLSDDNKEITNGVSERLKQIVKSYKHTLEHKEKIDLNDTKDLIYAVFDHLRKKYEKKLVMESVCESANFEVNFNDIGIKCRCWYTLNKIEMGVEYIRCLKNGMKSKYKKEHAYETRWTNLKRDDMLIWTCIHEFAHLFKGVGEKHTHDFFKLVEQFASENAFLFTNGQEKLKAYREMMASKQPELVDTEDNQDDED
jgi:hypothetical protein